MKILFIITKTEAGGAQTHVYQMATALRERGHEARIMSRPGGWLEQVAREEQIGFCPNPHLTNEFNPLRDIRAGIAIGASVRTFKPDIVSCHSSKAGIIARLAIRGRVPTIFTAHGWGFAERGFLASRFVYIPCEKLAAWYTRKLICVSQYLYDVAREHHIAPASRLVVIHNGVEPVPERPEKQLDGIVRILFVGRLVSQKDPETLLQAYASLPDAVRLKTRLRIIGDGDKKPALESFVKTHGLAGRVEMLGAVERRAVLEELLASDIFVLTTHYEGLPRTAIEAMHAGLPIVASDVWGVRELFDIESAPDNGEIGMLVPARSVADVRVALERLIVDDDLRRKLGQAARSRARRQFSMQRMVDDTIRVYQQVLHQDA